MDAQRPPSVRISPDNAGGVQIPPDNGVSVRIPPENARGAQISPGDGASVRIPPDNAGGAPTPPDNVFRARYVTHASSTVLRV